MNTKLHKLSIGIGDFLKLIPLVLVLLIASRSLLAYESATLPENVWVTIDQQTYAHLSAQHPKLVLKKSTSSKASDGITEVHLVEIHRSELLQLSQIMHDKFHRCGGFFTHLTKKAAQESIVPRTKARTKISYVIDNEDSVAALMTQLSTEVLVNVVNQLSSYYSRYYQTNTGIQAAEWLQSYWLSLAGNRDDIDVSFYEHASWPQRSVMVTIEGTTLPDEYVVVGGHLDSINRISPSSNAAPGVDDNASGIAVVSSVLDMIVQGDFYPTRSVILVGYAAEEVGLLGSAEIANEFRAQNRNVIGVAQFDMTAYIGAASNDITFISDFTDAAQNNFMASLIDTYHQNISYGFDVCGYACSDHASWDRAGFPASFPFEARFGDSNPDIHTSNDIYYDSDHMIKFAQLAASYVAELAKGEAGVKSIQNIVGFESDELSINSGSSVAVTISRAGSTTEAISVNYATVNGSAVAGVDYTSASGRLSWDANEGASKTIQIATSNTAIDKQFLVQLTAPSGGAVISSNGELQVTIKAVAQTPSSPSSGGGGSLSLWSLVLLFLFTAQRLMRRSDTKLK